MSRKSIRIVLMAACVIVSLAGMVAGASIVNSKHNFSADGNSLTNFGGVNFLLTNDEPVTEPCVFCHTPHNASPVGFLWNRSSPAATAYQMYDSATLTTGLKPSPGSAPTGLTLMCMSCHDGISSIAVGTLINAPYSDSGAQVKLIGDYDKIGQLYNNNDILMPSNWGPNIGNLDAAQPGTTANLSNDHPVSFTWIPGITGITEPSNGRWGSAPNELKLFNGRMECSTCHDVHNPGIEPFLRMSNAGSAMCMTCHQK